MSVWPRCLDGLFDACSVSRWAMTKWLLVAEFRDRVLQLIANGYSYNDANILPIMIEVYALYDERFPTPKSKREAASNGVFYFANMRKSIHALQRIVSERGKDEQ